MSKPSTKLALWLVRVPVTLSTKEVVFVSTIVEGPKTTSLLKMSTKKVVLTQEILREAKINILMKIRELTIKKIFLPMLRVIASH